MNDMKELFIQYKGILKDLLRYGVLKTEALEHTGLYNGKLGMTILFYEYSRYSGDALYEQFADEILESIMIYLLICQMDYVALDGESPIY